MYSSVDLAARGGVLGADARELLVGLLRAAGGVLHQPPHLILQRAGHLRVGFFFITLKPRVE